jgi:uncharacterized protein (TIGR04222 family)
MSLGPFDLTGGPFLTLYVSLLVFAVVAGIVIPLLMRPAGRTQRLGDVDQVAFLAGGRLRFADAVVARLLAANALVMTGKDRFSIAVDAKAGSKAENSVLALRPPIRWREVVDSLRPHVEPVERRLVAAGLLMSHDELAVVRRRATLPYLLLFVFGATKLAIGLMRDRPVGFLTLLLVVTAVLAILRWLTVDPRTQAGHEAVDHARRQAARLKIAPTDDEVGLGVALFGTGVLAGSGWSDFHRMRSAAGDGGSSGTLGGGDGGGGCGGGCGGCGG